VVDYIEQEVESMVDSMIVSISEVVGVDTKVMATTIVVTTDKTEEKDMKMTEEVIKSTLKHNVVATLTKKPLRTSD